MSLKYTNKLVRLSTVPITSPTFTSILMITSGSFGSEVSRLS
jgi:hypothetical protein